MTCKIRQLAILSTFTLLVAAACSDTQAGPSVQTPTLTELEFEALVLDEVEQVLAPLDRADAASAGLAIQAVDEIEGREAADPEPVVEAEDLMPGVIWVLQTGLKQAPQEMGTWNAALTRGQRVQIIKSSLTDNGYVRVQLSDQSSGFILAEDVLVGEVEELFAFESSGLFSEPDSKTTPKATLPLGTPLFVLGTEGEFVEVMLPGGERGYMHHTDLARDPEELTAARS